jgi:hypothetical protein
METNIACYPVRYPTMVAGNRKPIGQLAILPPAPPLSHKSNPIRRCDGQIDNDVKSIVAFGDCDS